MMQGYTGRRRYCSPLSFHHPHSTPVHTPLQGIDEATRAGSYAASVIIQRSGCTFPAKPSFVWN